MGRSMQKLNNSSICQIYRDQKQYEIMQIRNALLQNKWKKNKQNISFNESNNSHGIINDAKKLKSNGGILSKVMNRK